MLLFCTGEVEAEEVGEDLLVDLLARGGEVVVFGEGLARTGVLPHGRPILGPLALWIDGAVRGEDGAVEPFVGKRQPRGALVVEVGEGSSLGSRVLGGGGHDGGLAGQAVRYYGSYRADGCQVEPSIIRFVGG